MLEADDIEADIRAALGGGSVDLEPAAAPTAAAPEPVAEPPAAEPSVEGAQRDDKGRFAPKADALVDAAPKAVQPDPATPPAATELPKEAIRPPQSWSPTAKAAFANLDPIIQQEVLKREKDMDSGLAQWKPKGERLNRLDTVIDPIRDRLTLAGIDEVSYLQALTRADEMLRGPDKLNALMQVAQMYGIALPSGPQPAPQQIPQGMQAQPDPQYQALQHKLSELEGAWGKQQQLMQQQTEAQNAQERVRLEGEVEAFRTEHVYFDNVRDKMAALLKNGQAADLEDAYDQACWSDREIRQLLAAAPAPKPAAPTQARAVPAGLSPIGSPGLTAKVRSNNPSSDIEDDVRAALEASLGRV